MSLNSRDIERIQKSPSKSIPGESFLVWIVHKISKIPYFNRKIGQSIGGLSGRIYRHWRRKEYEQAAAVALEGMSIHRHKKSLIAPILDHHSWWCLAWDGAQSLKKGGVNDLYPEYIKAILAGPEPFEGIFVAKCFFEVSLWSYRGGSYEEGVRLASIASQADRTWAEPEFLLGWNGLVRGVAEAESHLVNAIERDVGVVFRIANDAVCKQHPALVKRLTEAYKSQSVEGGSNHSLKADGTDVPPP